MSTGVFLTQSLTHGVFLQLKADYIAMLKDFPGLDRHSRWSETKKKLESDPRYKAIESSSRREDWFRDYVKKLDDVSTITVHPWQLLMSGHLFKSDHLPKRMCFCGSLKCFQ